jgi:hypothetical protein
LKESHDYSYLVVVGIPYLSLNLLLPVSQEVDHPFFQPRDGVGGGSGAKEDDNKKGVNLF